MLLFCFSFSFSMPLILSCAISFAIDFFLFLLLLLHGALLVHVIFANFACYHLCAQNKNRVMKDSNCGKHAVLS